MSHELHIEPAPRRGLDADPQRFLIPVELDRTRILSFDNRAAFRIYQRYGAAFWRELFESDPNAEPDKKGIRPVRLRSQEAFEFFLWVGLQRDADEAGETLTVEQIQEHILPTTIGDLFNALLVTLAATRKPVEKNAKRAGSPPNAEGAAGAPVVN
jgi:hypothetical protein